MLHNILRLMDETQVVFYGRKTLPSPGTPLHAAYDCFASVPAFLITKAVQIHRPDLEKRINKKGRILTGIKDPYHFDPESPERGFLFVDISAGDCVSACVFGTNTDITEYHPDKIKRAIEQERGIAECVIEGGGEGVENARAYLKELDRGNLHLGPVLFESGNTYDLSQQQAARKLFVLWLQTLRGIKKFSC
jgi:hypothetical protein